MGFGKKKKDLFVKKYEKALFKRYLCKGAGIRVCERSVLSKHILLLQTRSAHAQVAWDEKIQTVVGCCDGGGMISGETARLDRIENGHCVDQSLSNIYL